MHGVAFPGRLITCLSSLLLVFCLLADTPGGARAATTAISAAYPVSRTYYDSWIFGRMDSPPPAHTFPGRTQEVAYFFSYRGDNPDRPGFQARLYGPRGNLLVTHDQRKILCYPAGHGCFDLFRAIPTFPNGSYHIDLWLDSARVASISFSVGSSGTSTPSVYQVKAFYTITEADESAASNSGSSQDPPHTAAFPAGVKTVGYYITVKGTVAHTRYQVALSVAGQGVVYKSTPASLFSAKVSLPANDVYTASTFSTLSSQPYIPSGAYRLDLLLDGTKAASTTFSVGN